MKADKYSNYSYNAIIRLILANKFVIIQTLLLLIFVIFCLGLVFSNGVCCGDDAYYAIIAKNFGNRLGYTSTILDSRSNFRETIFDPRAGVGPTIILPAALIIKLSGNTHWAPGLTIIILWGALLILIKFVLSKIIKNQLFITIGIINFIFFSYIFFAYHFEHWYALFGEIPAALLIILAVLIFFQKESQINSFLTGLLFSFAGQAKPIAMLTFISFLIFILFYYLIFTNRSGKGSLKLSIIHLILIFIGFLTPIFLFELWKYLKLGFSGYQVYWTSYLFWAREKGMEGTSLTWSHVLNRIDIINQRFGMFLPVIMPILIGNILLLRKDKKLSYIYYCFFSIVICYILYWVLFSIGWARYFIIGLVIILFMLILPLLSNQTIYKYKIIYSIILIAISIYNISVIDISYPLENIELFKSSEYTKSIENMTSILSSQRDKAPFITQWWATAADLEYSMNTHLNFTTYKDTEISLDQPYILVANSKFIIEDDQEFNTLLLQCDTKDVGQFLYGICDPVNNR